ncbi:N-acetylmuramoyl-L-alanine amidase [Paenibacillus enshidis]|uniref:N-acetylmuramoyl-L-alanine amidase n=1 Tax=Paenibacillus enshidis TaxID=1458439 RepID=A0ABV5AMK0_9BACL
MKKLGFLLFLFVFMWAAPNYGHAASAGAHIVLDGKQINVSGSAQPGIINGTTMVPFRVISENLGYKVDWKQENKTVQVFSGGTEIQLVIGSKSATVNGKRVTLNVAPVIRSGSALVPLRFIGEQMGVDVDWDGSTKTVTLVTRNSGPGNEGSTPPASGNDSTDGNAPSKGLALVNGISFSDNRMLITTTGTVKPNTFTMAGPDRLVIDLPNAAFSDTFGDSLPLNADHNGELAVTDSDNVSKIRYALFSDSPSTVRVVIDLNKVMGYKAYNEGVDLVIVDLTENSSEVTPPVGGDGKKVVVIDAGHGAKDPGASAGGGNNEKTFNLAMALKVEQILKQNPDLDVVMTRSDDTFLELKERVKVAENVNADVFVSIHANSAGSSAASGTETYYQRSSSKNLANTVHKHLVAATQLTNRGVRYGNFHVIRETSMPAVLLEVGYLSNSNDAAALFSEDFQNRVAQGIADGIEEYLGVN